MYDSTTQIPVVVTPETGDGFGPIKITLYTLIFTLTMIGNGILTAAIVKFKNLRTPQNLLVLNLSFCDMFLVCSIPFEIAHTVVGHFLLGATGCKLLYPLSTMALISAVFTLLSIAVERYRQITSPFKFKFTRRKSLIIIAVIHVGSLLSVVPYMLHLQIDNGQCNETWTPASRKIYTLYLFLIQYGVPLPVMIILYAISWWTIRKHNLTTIKIIESNTRRVDDHQPSLNDNINNDNDTCNSITHRSQTCSVDDVSADLLAESNRGSKIKSWSHEKVKGIQHYVKKMRIRTPLKKTNYFEASLQRQKQTIQTLKMFICVITVFAICMLPNQITWILLDFSDEGPTEGLKHAFYFLTFTNSVCNPWIYGGISPLFRRAYRTMICPKQWGNRKHLVTNTVVSRVSFSSNSNSPMMPERDRFRLPNDADENRNIYKKEPDKMKEGNETDSEIQLGLVKESYL